MHVTQRLNIKYAYFHVSSSAWASVGHGCYVLRGHATIFFFKTSHPQQQQGKKKTETTTAKIHETTITAVTTMTTTATFTNIHIHVHPHEWSLVIADITHISQNCKYCLMLAKQYSPISQQQRQVCAVYQQNLTGENNEINLKPFKINHKQSCRQKSYAFHNGANSNEMAKSDTANTQVWCKNGGAREQEKLKGVGNGKGGVNKY